MELPLVKDLVVRQDLYWANSQNLFFFQGFETTYPEEKFFFLSRELFECKDPYFQTIHLFTFKFEKYLENLKETLFQNDFFELLFWKYDYSYKILFVCLPSL